jgi:DNA helicase-2/ATP-dependent DNA helicase PcrA
VASRGAQSSALGLDADGERRKDRFLPAIAALIDPRQFDLISRPTAGVIVVQGSAGSGKTTIALHRIAYLAFVDPQRFRPDRMMVVVYQRALAAYVSRVLPQLDVPNVPVMTFAAWAETTRRRVFADLDVPISDSTPSVVMRAKSHRAMLHMLGDHQTKLGAWCRNQLTAAAAKQTSNAETALAFWDGTQGPLYKRVEALAEWVEQAGLASTLRAALGTAMARMRERTGDVVCEWAVLLTDRQALAEGFARHAPGLFSESQIDQFHHWCSDRERLRTATADVTDEDPAATEAGLDDAGDPYALDAEDDVLLLRMHQLQKGPLVAHGRGGQVIAHEHLMVDEVQDFGPVELAALLGAATKPLSVTLAGDGAQAIADEHGFGSWTAMLDDLGLPHDVIEPLRVSYRSTREIVDCAQHVLGTLAGDERPVAPRTGAPVAAFGFATTGEASDFLARALKEFLRQEPMALVALVARHTERARLYHQALVTAGVPGLRLVADQDFSFQAGVDVTDVRQTKGLEFDVVILLDVDANSYPETDQARRMLHVGMTRSAHQLWVTYTGAPSPLLPKTLI